MVVITITQLTMITKSCVYFARVRYREAGPPPRDGCDRRAPHGFDLSMFFFDFEGFPRFHSIFTVFGIVSQGVSLGSSQFKSSLVLSCVRRAASTTGKRPDDEQLASRCGFLSQRWSNAPGRRLARSSRRDADPPRRRTRWCSWGWTRRRWAWLASRTVRPFL